MNFSDLKSFLGEDWTKTEDLICSSLKSDINLLNETNELLLSNSGKQLRPILSLLCARACAGGSVSRDSIRFAAAAELLHNATLLHDDVADDSPQRRGRPTVYSLLGAQASVLIGDYWLVKAMQTILSARSRVSEVVRIFSKTLSDLAEGEMLQLQKTSTADTTQEDYFRIIYSKTASLFEASALSAAISVGASEEWTKAVRDYAVSLGLAFQIRDDIFDYSTSSVQIGKPVGIDLHEQKITLPLLGALAKVSDSQDKRIRQMVSEIVEKPSYADQIRDFVLENGGVEYAQAKLNEYVDAALHSLIPLPDSPEKEWLDFLARFTADRKK